MWRIFKLMPWQWIEDKTIYWNDIVDLACLEEYQVTKEQEEMKEQQAKAMQGK
jgi:hypothetical protein